VGIAHPTIYTTIYTIIILVLIELMRKSKKTNQNFNYEEMISEIALIINEIEMGNIPLEDVFNKFELAVKKLKECDNFLQQGQEKMELLIEEL
jgi:exodeoxyribonuclease VII small subunit